MPKLVISDTFRINMQKFRWEFIAAYFFGVDLLDFLVLDGRSVDKTVEIAKKFGVTVKQQLGYGKGDAIAQGIRSSDFFGDYVVMIDADFTYPAKFIPDMVAN